MTHTPMTITPSQKRIDLQIPFTWELSKNKMWRSNFKSGHVYMNQGTRTVMKQTTLLLKGAINRAGFKFVKARVWIGLFIEKPENRGDAINLLDTICDCIKDAIGIDDRYFAVREVNWRIKESNPKITITISQEATSDFHFCPRCGGEMEKKLRRIHDRDHCINKETRLNGTQSVRLHRKQRLGCRTEADPERESDDPDRPGCD